MASRTSHPGSTFAYAFGITPKQKDTWFDPALHRDTQLFVDPFLMFETESGPWSTVEDRMVAFFNEVLGLVADAGGDRSSSDWKRAATMLSFPEPAPFCLGYGKETIFGAGSGSGLGRAMLETANTAVIAGVKDIKDFGEIMLFGENFGADRISDMTCNIVMDLFIEYTQKVATRHGLPVETFVLPHAGYDFNRKMWRRKKVQLPRNPCWIPHTPVLLVPDDYVIDLPVMDDGAFWDWVYNNFNDQLRSDLNIAIGDKLDRRGIIARAKKSPNVARRYGIRYAQHLRDQPPSAYNVKDDPKELLRPLHGAQFFATEATTDAPHSAEGFCAFLNGLVGEFKWMAENRRLRENFWANDKITPVSESLAQNLFDAGIVLKCKQLNIDVSPESDAGRGPVDFKVGKSWEEKGLVEMKFAKSSSYWRNLEKQTPEYLKAEDAKCGIFLVIQHFDEHCTDEFVAKTEQIVAKVSADSGIDYSVVFVDVRPKPSASKM